MADPTNPWDSDPIVAQAPTAPPPADGTSVTLGTPHAPQPKPHELPASPQPALTPQEKASHGLPPDAPYFWGPDGVPTLPTGYQSNTQTNDAQKQQALEATHQLIGSIEKARGFVFGGNSPVGNLSTGLGYNLLHGSPMPTEASQLDTTIKGEIQGNIFKSWMSAMKAATEKGGSAFGGRIMQSEIPFIVNSLGALTPGKLTTQQFLDNLDQVEQRAIASAAMVNGENPDDPKVMAKYRQMFIPPAQGNNNGTGANPGDGNGGTSPDGTTPPSGNDPVKDELTKRLQSGEDPADTIHWLVSIGRPPDKQTIQAIIANRGNQNPDVRENGILHDLGVGVGGVAQGVGDMANLISTPFTEGVNAVFGTHFNPDMGANLRSVLGTPNPQNGPENMAYAINRYGTAALSMANAAKLAAARVPGIVGNALEAFGSRPLTDAASGSTGGASAEFTRQMGGGPLAQTVAGIAGGIPSIAAGNKLNALSTATNEVPSLVRAGQQEGVTVNRAMADPSLQSKVIANGKTMAGAKIMGKQMAQVGDQIGNRVQAAVGDGGNVLSPQDAGNLVAGAGTRYITDTGAQFNRLYGSLQKATAGVKIPATQATQQIDDVIGQLSEMPNQNAKEISYLQGLKQDLSQPLSIDALRGLRTNLRQTLAKGDLTFGPQEARVQGIADAAAQDITNGLNAAGKSDVASRFQQVDQAYRDRMDMVQNVVQKLTGTRQQNLSGEQVYANLRSMAGPRGNASGLTRMIGQMTPDEQSDIRATFANALGKDSNGNFSPAVLARNVNGDTAAGIPKMPQAMRVAIFGEDGAKSLGNLAQLAQEQARVKGALGNSPTALALDAKSLLRNVILGAAGAGAEGAGSPSHALAGAAIGAGVTGAKVAANALTARGLMSSKLTGLLRAAPQSADPAAINAWANRLKALAVREPALAPEIQSLQSAMIRTANSNVTPSAAASGADQGN